MTVLQGSAELILERVLSSQFAQDGMRRVVSGRAGDAASRVGAGTAEPEIRDGRPVVCPARQRSHEEHLFQRDVAVEDIALGNAKGFFEINRRIDAPGDYRCGYIGRELPDECGYAIPQVSR